MTAERLAREIAEAHRVMECGRLLEGAVDEMAQRKASVVSQKCYCITALHRLYCRRGGETDATSVRNRVE